MSVLDLDAELIPGVGAAGLTIGQPAADLLRLGPPDEVEPRIGCRVLKYGPVLVFVDAAGVVTQFCVFAGYRGKVAGAVGVGSRAAEVEAAFGPQALAEDGGYQATGTPPWMAGDWSFYVEDGSPLKGDPAWCEARVDCICIMPGG